MKNLLYRLGKNRNNNMKDKNYIIIVGAHLKNAGAESMTCIVAKEMMEKYPTCELVFATTDKHMTAVKGKVMPYSFPTKYKNVLDVKDFLFMALLNTYESEEYFHIIENTKLIIDISGYSLTTKFGVSSIYSYIHRIYIAEKYKIPYYISPQSFGPFTFPNIWSKVICTMLMKKFLKYPKVIYAREKAGYDTMKKYCNNNLKYKLDMVLLYEKKIERNYVLKNAENSNITEKSYERAVALVPNEKILNKTANGREYIVALKEAIDHLLSKGYEIHIIPGCELDVRLCRKLKNAFEMSEKVVLYEKYLNCEEYIISIRQYDFVISSRYHAIVHAYRESIPCVALGWEDKYIEVLSVMGQQNYIVDCRKKTSIDNLKEKVESMIKNYQIEKHVINDKLRYLRGK